MNRMVLASLLPSLILFVGCAGSNPRYNSDIKKIKITDDFYKKTRFIMSKEEKQIYKHLPDNSSKKEFIKEFWEKRDPTPDNDENEALISYMERIKYANRWFRENSEKNSGWETERGRILLQLGIPDRREFGEMPYLRKDGRLATTKRLPMERWFYYRYKLYLVFTDNNGFGKFKLAKYPATLLTAIDLAKISILDNGKGLSHRFRFKCSVKNDNIIVRIPTKFISFKEENGRVKASFEFRVYKYLDFNKAGVIKVKKSIEELSDKILSKREIDFKIDMNLRKPGKYFFDVIGKDILSDSIYRNFCKTRFKL